MIYGSRFKNMENLPNIIINVGGISSISLYVHAVKHPLFSQIFPGSNVFARACCLRWHWGLVARKSRFCCRLGLEKMINPLQEEEGMCSAWVDNLANGGVGRICLFKQKLIRFFWIFDSDRNQNLTDFTNLR